MNCRGDDDVDAKRFGPSIGKTREVPREERARAFGRDPISDSHQGQRPARLHSKAGYMAAPETLRADVRFLLHRGRRPYMALLSHGLIPALRPLLRVIRTSRGCRRMTDFDPERSLAGQICCSAQHGLRTTD